MFETGETLWSAIYVPFLNLQKERENPWQWRAAAQSQHAAHIQVLGCSHPWTRGPHALWHLNNLLSTLTRRRGSKGPSSWTIQCVRKSEFWPGLCHLLAVGPWASHDTFLNFRFLSHYMTINNHYLIAWQHWLWGSKIKYLVSQFLILGLAHSSTHRCGSFMEALITSSLNYCNCFLSLFSDLLTPISKLQAEWYF